MRSPAAPEDRDLVQAALGGDTASFKILVERYQARVYAVAWGLLHNQQDARDVTQEALLKAWRNLPSFRRDSSFYTWLYRITVNVGIDFRRRAYRSRETALDDSRLPPDGASPTSARPISNPGDSLLRRELRGRIREAIAQLPDEQRAAIVLREVEGLSYKEIAEAMDCAEGTVMSRLFYARKKLQALLADVRPADDPDGTTG